MELKVIETEQEYESYLEWVDEQFDDISLLNAEDKKVVDAVLILIKQYEDEHYVI